MAERITHRASGMARFTVLLRSYVALSAFVVVVLLGAALVLTPPRLRVECSRADGACTMDSRYPWLGPSHFPISQAEDLTVLRSGHYAALGVVVRGHPNYWSGETRDPHEIAALEADVERLHRFAAGEGDAVALEVPTGRPIHPVVLVFVGLFGLAMAAIARRTILSSELVVDDAAGEVAIVLRRGWSLPQRTRLPIASLRAIRAVYVERPPQRKRYAYTRVALDGDDGLTPLLDEYYGKAAVASARALGERLSAALRLPVEEE
ncbi:MAG: hypothetical protein R3B09_21130 [Nannocystaceae bacterium]